MKGDTVHRTTDVPMGESLVTQCPRCGRAITLKFNGGELDRAECCGLRYALECEGIDLVVTEA